jgi:carbonic anhydrase/acetyltransferase-like protein (isoleucine patch superfamily)
MFIESQGFVPRIASEASIAPTAVISGDVVIGPHTCIGHGAVITAEGGPIVIGSHCVIMDTAVIRGVPGQRTTLGDHVMVGPRAYLVGCVVEDEVFLATGATVFNGAHIGRGAEVRINGLVHLRTALPANATVPIGWVAVGTPAHILPPNQHDQIWAVQQSLDFPKYVFGLDRSAPGDGLMPTLMQRYARSLVRRHAGDRNIPPQSST